MKGQPPTSHELFRIFAGLMEAALPIEAHEWTEPDRARDFYDTRVEGVRNRAPKDYSSLEREIAELRSGERFSYLVVPNRGLSRDAERVFLGLMSHRDSEISMTQKFGIPDPARERYGMMMSERLFRRNVESPVLIQFFDEYVPIKCEEGIARLDPENPGLRYWYPEKCTHPDHFRRFEIDGEEVPVPAGVHFGNIIIDHERRRLWSVR